MQIQRISCQQAAQFLQEKPCQFVDIRDPQSFAIAHPKGALHLSDQSLDSFLLDADPDQCTLVICYHGNSSQSAAAYLMEKDFTDVYSVDGGFEQWQQLFPEQVERSN